MEFKPTDFEWHKFDHFFDNQDEWPEWHSVYVIFKDKYNKEYKIEFYADEEYTDDDYWCVWDYDLPEDLDYDDIREWKYDPEFYTKS